MSTPSIESAMYDLSVKRASREAFLADPRRFLLKYSLTAEEMAELMDFNVRALQARGASPLLTMGFWTTTAKDRSLQAYLNELKNLKEA